MTKNCWILLAIIFVPATFCTPAISKYDLNVGFVEAGLSKLKLEPERELRSGHVEFIRSRPIQQSREIETSSESVSSESLFERESDEDNEIRDDSGADTRLFASTSTDDEDSVSQDSPQMREVIHSFLQVIPNNTLMSQLFGKVADTIILNDPHTVDHIKIKSRS